jgi:hypothetical protein
MVARSTVEEEGQQTAGGHGLEPYLHLALDADAPRRPPRRFSLADVEAVAIGRGRPSAPPRSGGQLAI